MLFNFLVLLQDIAHSHNLPDFPPLHQSRQEFFEPMKQRFEQSVVFVFAVASEMGLDNGCTVVDEYEHLFG
jgi:hypothetical protein